jgi:hypothetical protein
MTFTVWTQPSGYSLGLLQERQTVRIPLPIVEANFYVRFELISGKLPKGLRLAENFIVGTPFEVSRTTEFKFVIRATDGNSISDRTFSITVEGADEPKWLTPAGPLPVGTNDAYYVIDSSFIDFNLSAIDTDTSAGQQLTYFIATDEGELPPGLILLPSGRITGFIQPLLSLEKNTDQGFYDSGLFDSVAYDFGYRSTNGYDTYVFDLVTYDFSVETRKPRKLNRNYEFIATITDGDTVTKRKFRIFVVGDDFFRADNVIMQAGNGVYTADVSYVRAPIFTTPQYLGLRRANNYQTFKIDIFEGFTDLGPVIYEWCPANALINGVCQRETASDNREGSSLIRYERSSGVPEVGYKINFGTDIPNAGNVTYTVTEVDVLGGTTYRLTVSPSLAVTIPNGTGIFLGTESVIPSGMEFDPTTGEVFGKVGYQPAVTEQYQFTIKATRFGQGSETSSSRRVFTVDLLGEIESAINWLTPRSLGTIDVGFPSSLFVKATTTLSTSAVLYSLEEGTLPPGLDLNLDGEIVGKVSQLLTENSYKSFWKPVTSYKKTDVIKRNNNRQVKSLLRRRNTATIITTEDHDFKSGNIVKVNSSQLNFNSYTGSEISADLIKINSVVSIEGNGPYRVKIAIPSQKLPPLAPVFTLYKGLPISTGPAVYNNVPVKSSSGVGTGARFLIEKLSNGSLGTATYVGVTRAILLNPGSGYLPGDNIVISGSVLGGVDGVNDLTFKTSTGLEFWYRLNGNSNSRYNGRKFASSYRKEIIQGTLTDTLTFIYDTNPGTFGTGTISVTTGVGTYEAQTQLVPLNYFNYTNLGSSAAISSATGNLIGPADFYQATENHISDLEFTTDKWTRYKFPVSGKTVTTFDKNLTIVDDLKTSIDRSYTFTIKARDQLNYSAITKEFSLNLNVPNDAHYSNIFVKPLMQQRYRDLFKDFINNSEIFNPRLLYRPNDSNFGIQRDLKSLVYAGIETLEAAKYVSAMGRNHKPKRFNLGAVKKAVAKVPGTNEVVYEVLYIDLLDPLEKNKIHLPFTIKQSSSNVNVTIDNNNEFYKGPFNIDSQYWKRPIPFNSSIDRTDIFAGDPGTAWKFPSSISIWRKRLRAIEQARRERNYLPLWMRSIQPGETEELDFVAAVPLCFCKPGSADEILLNIKNSQFDFKLLNYTVDRYIIDSIDGYYADKYLAFRNDRTTIV